jgi:hypothetical protein
MAAELPAGSTTELPPRQAVRTVRAVEAGRPARPTTGRAELQALESWSRPTMERRRARSRTAPAELPEQAVRKARPSRSRAAPERMPPAVPHPMTAPRADSTPARPGREAPQAGRRAIPTTARAVPQERLEPEAEVPPRAEVARRLGAGRPRWERAQRPRRAMRGRRQAVRAAAAMRREERRPTLVPAPAVQAEPVPRLEIPRSPDPASRPRTPTGPSSARRQAARSRSGRPVPGAALSAAPRSRRSPPAEAESQSIEGWETPDEPADRLSYA